jgi:hypothetical protein
MTQRIEIIPPDGGLRGEHAGGEHTGVRVPERVHEVDVLIAAGSREALERLEAL